MIKLHPLVLLNIADHLQRDENCYGALLGKNDELFTSFEVKVVDLVLDKELFTTRLEQFKLVMDYDFLGFYTVSDMELNQFESKIILRLDKVTMKPSMYKDSKEQQFQITATKEEQISMEKVKGHNVDVMSNLTLLEEAFEQLLSRIQRIKHYLEGDCDDEILRRISALYLPSCQFQESYSDSVMMLYLSAISRGISTWKNVAEFENLRAEPQKRRKRIK